MIAVQQLFFCLIFVASYFSVGHSLTWQQDLCTSLSTSGISEGTGVGSDIGLLQAQDPQTQQITYSTTSTVLAVDETTGRVQLGRQVNREVTETINVTFSARDSSGNQIFSSCVVPVLDVNDNAPVFQQTPYSATVFENAGVGSTVFDLISVSDADIGNNANVRLSCFVASGDETAAAACQKFEVRQEMISTGNYRGRIIVRETLDYETTTSYVLTVRATDEGQSARTSQTTVEIQVQDVQDSPPAFLTQQLTLSVPENTPPSTPLSPPIEVRDQDTGVPRTLRITITSDPQNLFKLGAVSIDTARQTLYVVNVETSGLINRETLGDSYEIQVQAVELNQDNQETSVSASMTVTISILDQNDNSPMFNQQQYSIQVPEEQLDGTDLPGLTIIVSDPDVGDNSYYELSVQNDPRSQMTMSAVYSVSPVNGTGATSVILIAVEQDFTDYEVEAYRTQYLQIVAKETRSVEALSSTATVTIMLTDRNDNLPQFEFNQYTASVRENEGVGTLIRTITATDVDSGSFGDVTYSLSGTGSEKFVVSNQTGGISLAGMLDFESQSIYNLQFEATDGGGRTQSVPFRVNVLDFNDEGPVFQRAQYDAILLETNVELLPALMVSAIDADSDFPVTYSIISGNTADNAFQIDPNTGLVSVLRPIDVMETPNRQGFIELLIEASDNGLVPQKSTVLAVITIRDINDNAPVFGAARYFGEVREITPIGVAVVNVSATDMDLGDNAQIRYLIAGGHRDNFAIDETNGVISTAVTDLNIERFTNTYNIEVYAIDSGSPQRTGTAEVTINVIDSNNQIPTFTQSAYVFTVPETAAIGTVVETLTARDPDTTASLVYTIRPGSITAADKNGNPVTNTAPFDYPNAFMLNRRTGAISTALTLNRNQVAQVTFVIQANDTGAEIPIPQIGVASVQINVISSTDGGINFPPPWTPESPEFVITVPEESPEQSVVTQVTATDPQTGSQITDYREVAGSDPGNYFIVEQNTGRILLNRRLDYESLPSKTLTFQIQAFSPPPDPQSAVATIRVIVEDINDHSPSFVENRYEYLVPENVRYPTALGPAVRATDSDSGNFSSITYSLSGQNSQLFYIDPTTGSVSVAPNVTLDRETVGVYNLLVHATDNVGGEGEQRITSVPMVITLQDLNDNFPVFQQTVYNIYSLETVGPDTSLGQVVARDEDIGLNGQIDYSIESGNEQGLFYIETQTGIVRSRIGLAGYAQELPYQLVISAKDPTSNPNIARVNVNMYVNDLQSSEGKPRVLFPPEGETFKLNEGAGVGTNVTQINAEERNPKPGSKIIYGFVVNEALNEDSSKFNIDPDTGLITVKQPLDYETQTTYELIILIRTNGVPPQEVQRRIYINVTDADDNLPSFRCAGREYVNPVSAGVLENLPPGQFISQVQACDADGPGFNTIYYFIICGNEPDFERFNGSRPFTIDKMTGAIYSAVALDREYIASYEVCVMASNFPQIQINGTTRSKRQTESVGVLRVTITVIDVDDSGPSFEQLQQETYVVGVLATARYGTSVTRLQVTDQDTNPAYRQVTYSLRDERFVSRISESTPLAFKIDPVTGLVVTNLNSYITYIDGYFVMKVVATDSNQRIAQHDLFIHVVRDSQRLRFVFNDVPNEVKGSYPSFLSLYRVKFLPTYQINSDTNTLHYSVLEEGRIDFQKTDICFHMVSDNRVVNADIALDVIQSKENTDPTVAQLYNRYRVDRVDVCEVKTTTQWWSGYWWLWWLLIALALFIFVVCLIMICCICYFWPKYKRNYPREKPYMILDSPVAMSMPDYEWQEEIVKME